MSLIKIKVDEKKGLVTGLDTDSDMNNIQLAIYLSSTIAKILIDTEIENKKLKKKIIQAKGNMIFPN